MNKKMITTVKVGYSAGIYGCTNEYFTTTIVTPTGLQSLQFKGLFGTESRIEAIFKNAGYETHYTNSSYGKVTQKRMGNLFLEEEEAVEQAKKIVEAN